MAEKPLIPCSGGTCSAMASIGIETPSRELVSRPMEHLSSADIVKLHARGKPVPMLEFTLVRVE